MNQAFSIPKGATQKRSIAADLRAKASELDSAADDMIATHARRYSQKSKDVQLNRTQCLKVLSIGTLTSLKRWERTYRPLGYLQFQDNKIMRSELLRFIDDKQSGKIERKRRIG